MNGSPYVPQVGTIERKCVEWLRSMPVGTERSTVELAEYCDQPLNGFLYYLKTARDVGLLVARNRDGERSLYWSLNAAKLWPENEAAAATQPSKPKKAPDTSAAAAPLGTADTPAPCQREAAPAAPTPQPEEINKPAQGPRTRLREGTGPMPARWGIFSDGEFMLQKGDTLIQLSRDEFQPLLTFLSRVFAENAE